MLYPPETVLDETDGRTATGKFDLQFGYRPVDRCCHASSSSFRHGFLLEGFKRSLEGNLMPNGAWLIADSYDRGGSAPRERGGIRHIAGRVVEGMDGTRLRLRMVGDTSL